MRGRTLARAAFPVLVCLAAVMWLVWGFLAWTVAGKTVLTLLALLLSTVLIRRRYRQKRPAQKADDAGHFPPENIPDQWCWSAVMWTIACSQQGRHVARRRAGTFG